MMQTSRFSFRDDQFPVAPLDPLRSPALPPERSESQREASRRNGAKSRGPKTLEGKARSSRNAITHGVFVRKIRPPKDGRQEHREFDLLEAQLLAEYRPKNITDKICVSLLARDLIQLGRLLRLQEAVMAPQHQEIRGGVNGPWVGDLQLDVALLNELEQNCAKDLQLSLAESSCKRLIAPIQKWIKEGKKLVAEYRSLVVKGRKRIDSELRTAAEEYIALGVEEQADDEQSIIAVLTGQAALDHRSSPLWCCLFSNLREAADRELRSARAGQLNYDNHERLVHTTLLDRLPSTDTLLRHENAVRRKIARAIETLDRLKAGKVRVRFRKKDFLEEGQ